MHSPPPHSQSVHYSKQQPANIIRGDSPHRCPQAPSGAHPPMPPVFSVLNPLDVWVIVGLGGGGGGGVKVQGDRFKTLEGMIERGAVIREILAIRGGRSSLPSWRTFWEKSRRDACSDHYHFLGVCVRAACARVCFLLSWQAVVSVCACVHANALFVLWVFKCLTRCLLVYQHPDVRVYVWAHADAPATPPPTASCLFITRQHQ